MAELRPRGWQILATLLLLVATLVVYWPVLHSGFIDYDDPTYVSQNPMVQGGLTANGVHWAFTTFYGGNWHPMTWLSHMFDSTLFGPEPACFHLMNLGLHLTNTLLLLLLLVRSTGLFTPAFLVAALFALHPLHVESVAWISERKDVLSTFFFLLTLLSYLQYVRGKKLFYALALLFFALGLMAKPMLVTVPFVLILVDLWPLQRKNFVDKVPFFILAIIAAVITVKAQASAGSVASLQHSGLGARLANTTVAYFDYAAKTIWPARLAVFYPYVDFPPVWKLLFAAAALIGFTFFCFRQYRTAPYWLFGWLWFLGTLAPVSGLITFGQAAMADRYTYIPLLGLFIAIAWAVHDYTRQYLQKTKTIYSSALVALLLLAGATRLQAGYWQNSEALFRHADEVTPNNYLAQTVVGQSLAARGQLKEAKIYYLSALKIKPDFADAHFAFANILLGEGKIAEAVAEFRHASDLNPLYFEPRRSLGLILAQQQKWAEAEKFLRAAQKLSLGDFDVALALGNCLLVTGPVNEAAQTFREALLSRPDSVEALNRIAWLLSTAHDPETRNAAEALRYAQHACELTHNSDPRSLLTFAAANAESGKFTDALAALKQARALATPELRPILDHLEALFAAQKPFHED